MKTSEHVQTALSDRILNDSHNEPFVTKATDREQWHSLGPCAYFSGSLQLHLVLSTGPDTTLSGRTSSTSSIPENGGTR
jgi:hypothetical protein